MSAPYHHQNKSLYTLLCFALLFGIANCQDEYRFCPSVSCSSEIDLTWSPYVGYEYTVQVTVYPNGVYLGKFFIARQVKSIYLDINAASFVTTKAIFTDGQTAMAERDNPYNSATVEVPIVSEGSQRYVEFDVRNAAGTSVIVNVHLRMVSLFETSNDESSGLSTGAVVAIAVVISVVGVAAIVVGVTCHLQKKKRMAVQRKIQAERALKPVSVTSDTQLQQQPQQMMYPQPQPQPYMPMYPQPQPQPQMQITIQTGPQGY